METKVIFRETKKNLQQTLRLLHNQFLLSLRHE